LRQSALSGRRSSPSAYAGPDGKVVNMKSPKEILFDKTIISEQSLLYADLEYFSKKANLFKGRSSYFHDASAHGGILARNSEIKRIMKEILVETGSS
jgi:hypothetical protein